METLSLLFLHLVGSIVWGGGAIALGFFVVPAAIEAGPAGSAVLGGATRRGLPTVMVVAASVVLLTGLRLYMLRFSAEWLRSAEGIVVSLGALFAVEAFAMGVGVQRPTAGRLAALGGAIAARGGPPTAEEAAQLAALTARLGQAARRVATRVSLAALLMAGHRLAAMT